ncbi:MAG: hypothetical protein HYS17_08460 [Micavibrio aeruginosavorus]|uniref:Uncharacterized protein n=1 Tax=Micavibrio aeruginosavorus TaxID=349221 RepID=A0A7T5UG68_9BACT|nr:MAG: hypothetical protein HYS17_08460 [Micavibrio aeruginosavorus]
MSLFKKPATEPPRDPEHEKLSEMILAARGIVIRSEEQRKASIGAVYAELTRSSHVPSPPSL